MPMTKQRKILGGVLALGLGALAVDRFVLGPPQSASASDVGLPAQSTPASDSPVVLQAPSSSAPAFGSVVTPEVDSLVSYTKLADRLIALDSSIAVPSSQTSQPEQSESMQSIDPFRLPENWRPDAGQPEPLIGGQKKDTAAADFLRKHRLDGTFRSQEQQRAVIDGYAMRLDEVLEGYKLVEIAERWVVWRSVETGQPVVMKAPEP